MFKICYRLGQTFGHISGLIILARYAHAESLYSAKYVFYIGESETKTYKLNQITKILQHKKFDIWKTTTLYAHGYGEVLTAESIKTIVSAYSKRNDHNLIVLDWSVLAGGRYFVHAVPNVKRLSPLLASGLIELINHGLPADNLHLVGHSLGGQLVGAIGRNVIQQSNGNITLRRITGLDPAFPGFYPGFFTRHISPSDAKFVDIIHTDPGVYGAPCRTGTADFYPNGITDKQPGCPTRDYKPLSEKDVCSHRRSWVFWTESVADLYPNKFNAVKAKTWFHFNQGYTAEFNPNVVMGLNCPENIEGKYFLNTNAETPFAKGIEGIK